MAKKINLGLVGFGRLGSIHAQNIVSSEDAELAAICDIDSSALQRAAAQYPVKAFANIDDFLAVPLDGVVIASSTSMHLAHIQSTTKAGIPIFTEKPIGLTLEQTDEVLQEIVDSGIPFQIGFQRRWDPRYLKVKAIINSGEIGEPVLFKAYGRDSDASNPVNWGLDKNGGLFLNAAIHDYDVARFLLGKEVEKLSATGGALVYRDLAMVGDIDTCTTTLFMEGGTMAMTEWSRYATYGYDIGMEIVATEGMVQIGRKQTSSVNIFRRNENGSSVFDVFADAYKAEIDGFITAIKQGSPMTPGVEDARIALQLALGARESFETGNTLIQFQPLKTLEKHLV